MLRAATVETSREVSLSRQHRITVYLTRAPLSHVLKAGQCRVRAYYSSPCCVSFLPPRFDSGSRLCAAEIDVTLHLLQTLILGKWVVELTQDQKVGTW